MSFCSKRQVKQIFLSLPVFTALFWLVLHIINFYLINYFLILCIYHPSIYSCSWLEWLVSESQEPPISAYQHWVYRHIVACMSLYRGMDTMEGIWTWVFMLCSKHSPTLAHGHFQHSVICYICHQQSIRVQCIIAVGIPQPMDLISSVLCSHLCTQKVTLGNSLTFFLALKNLDFVCSCYL